MDCNKNKSLEETTDTRFEVQDSNEGCVKEAQPKKISPSRQEDDCLLKKSLKMKRYDDKVQLGTGSFSCTVKGYQRRFGSKGDRTVNEVFLDRRSFSCQEGGCQKKFSSKGRLNAHVACAHSKKRPFSTQEHGRQKKLASKTSLDEHVASVHLKKKPFSCKEEGCHMKFAEKTG